MQKSFYVAAVAAVLSLSACGDTALEQGVMGAGAGAVAATVLGTDPITGAALGAGANVVFCQQNPSSCN